MCGGIKKNGFSLQSQSWCSKCHSPKKKDAKALEDANLLPEAEAAQLLAKQNAKRKKKHATEKCRNLKKQRENVAFVLPPGKVAISKMAIRKKKVSSKSVSNRAAIRAKDSSASVSKDVCDSEHSDSDSGSDARDLRDMLHKSSDDSSAGDDSEEDDSSASVNSESASEDMTSSKDIRDILMSYSIAKVLLYASFEADSKSEEDASARLQAQTVRMGKRYVTPTWNLHSRWTRVLVLRPWMKCRPLTFIVQVRLQEWGPAHVEPRLLHPLLF